MTTSQLDQPVATRRDWAGLAVILCATFMGQVDGFIVTLAAPSIQRDLPAGFDQIQLVGAAYVLACAAGLITGGRIGDRYGRRRTFLAGVAVFTAASLACGLAPNADLLIAARFLQGAAAAALVPQELALIRAMFARDGERTRAIGVYGVVIGLGVICGLAGGGFLVRMDVAGLGWRTAFLINVPIGAVILLLGRGTIPESRSSRAPTLDPAGVALTAVALPALLLPLVIGSGWVWLSVVVAAAALAALVPQQRAVAARGGEPLFPPRVLGARGMLAGLAAILTFFGGNAGLFLVFTYYVQTGLGMDPLAAGFMLVPLGAGFSFGSSVSGRLVARFGPLVPVAGCAFLALSLLAHIPVVWGAPGAQPVLLAVAIGVVGLAEGLVVSPLIAGIFDQVAPDDAGAASGVASTVTQFGLGTGYAAIGTWYGLVLGGTPGAADAPSDLGAHVQAYTAAILVLSTLALITSGLCALRLTGRRRLEPAG
ncbi:MFS transporter [Sphaerisporangium sp. NPDC051011]|uniref:MFS transporter n=1 Tax=Sphaerisporangium sp. NPDC051011 TaxID=3155792 RepID=UPI0033EF6A94